jgi:hypothetical protein
MVDRAGKFRLDTGIERILRQDASDDARLPELASILPSRQQIKAEVDQVLPQPHLARMLDGFVMPRIASPDLLLPEGFAAMFEEMRDLFAKGDGGAGGDRRGRNVPELDEARRLLDDEQASRELLHLYCNTLLGA